MNSLQTIKSTPSLLQKKYPVRKLLLELRSISIWLYLVRQIGLLKIVGLDFPILNKNLGTQIHKFDLYPALTRVELMTCNDCNHSMWSLTATTALTENHVEPLYRTFKALDEPDYLDLAYNIEFNKWYNGYLTFQDPNHPNPNVDNDSYYFNNISSSNILISFNNLPANSILSIYNSTTSLTPIDFTYSNSFNGGSASLLLNNLTSGYYYIKLSASPYNYPNCGVPAPWDNPYSFNISYSTTSTDNISISKDLIKITDVLGREVNEKRNTPLFYIYNDGTVEKKIIIE